MSGSDVRQWSSITMPPRSPISSCAARASSSCGLMPAEYTMRSVSSVLPSANTILCARPAPSTISFVLFELCTWTPSASICLRSSRPAGSSSCTAIRRGANSTTCVSSPRSFNAFAASRPRRPAADHRADARAPRGRADHFEVFDRAVNEAAAAVPAGNRRHEGKRAGGEHELVVRDFAIAAGAYVPAGAIDRERPGRSTAA